MLYYIILDICIQAVGACAAAFKASENCTTIIKVEGAIVVFFNAAIASTATSKDAGTFEVRFKDN